MFELSEWQLIIRHAGGPSLWPRYYESLGVARIRFDFRLVDRKRRVIDIYSEPKLLGSSLREWKVFLFFRAGYNSKTTRVSTQLSGGKINFKFISGSPVPVPNRNIASYRNIARRNKKRTHRNPRVESALFILRLPDIFAF